MIPQPCLKVKGIFSNPSGRYNVTRETTACHDDQSSKLNRAKNHPYCGWTKTMFAPFRSPVLLIRLPDENTNNRCGSPAMVSFRGANGCRNHPLCMEGLPQTNHHGSAGTRLTKACLPVRLWQICEPPKHVNVGPQTRNGWTSLQIHANQFRGSSPTKKITLQKMIHCWKGRSFPYSNH